MKTHFGIAGMIIGSMLLGVGVLGCQPSTRSAAAVGQFPVGGEERIGTGEYVNGYNVLDLGPCPFARVYREEALLLGPPVAGAAGTAQTFAVGRLECRPTAGQAEAPVTWANLGLAALLAEGRRPIAHPELPAAVRAYLTSFIEAGLDLERYFGTPLSGAVCAGDRCRTFLDKQVLTYAAADRDNFAPEAVTTEPLGCQATPACRRAFQGAALTQTAPRLGQPWLAMCWAAAVVLAIGGLALTVLGRRRGFGGGFVTG